MTEKAAIHESNETQRGLDEKSIIGIIVFNALPIFGVLFWGWKSFDLIFLYWLENLIIGAVALLRFIVKPHKNLAAYVMLCFMAPFFLIHYGMFCTVHGMFLIATFADETLQGDSFFNVYEQIPHILQANHLLYATLSLLCLQFFYWLTDVYKYGWNTFNIGQLMVAPYRRIVVLHITILGSGLLLDSMNEPLAGLILLVILKTLMDVFFYRIDEPKMQPSSVSNAMV